VVDIHTDEVAGVEVVTSVNVPDRVVGLIVVVPLIVVSVMSYVNVPLVEVVVRGSIVIVLVSDVEVVRLVIVVVPDVVVVVNG
jgi:hypothetical protein